jgi:hypothetical protein
MQNPIASIYSKSSNVITENFTSQHSGSPNPGRHYSNSVSSPVSKKNISARNISPRKTRVDSPKTPEKQDRRSKLGIPGVPYRSPPGIYLAKPPMGAQNPLSVQRVKTDSIQASPHMQISPLNLSPIGDKRKVSNFHPLSIMIPRRLSAEPDLRIGEILDIDDCSPNHTTRTSAVDSDGRDIVPTPGIFAGGKMVEISARPDQFHKRFSKQNTTPASVQKKQNTTPASVGKKKEDTEELTPELQNV